MFQYAKYIITNLETSPVKVINIFKRSNLQAQKNDSILNRNIEIGLFRIFKKTIAYKRNFSFFVFPNTITGIIQQDLLCQL